MQIEKEIKQSHFFSEYQKLVINILFTSNWISLNNNQRLKIYGISTEQFNILRILRGQFPKAASIQLLVDRMLNKSSNASRIVDKLKLKGLVTRAVCIKDKRLVEVIITDLGLQLLEQTDKSNGDFENTFKTITESEAMELNRILDKLRN